MANPALHWKYVGVQTFVSSISNAHDALYTLGTATTYANGAARTPGSGSAWTWAKETSGVTVSVYGTPPTNALGFKYILAGVAASSAYTFLSPDTAVVGNVIVYGMNRGSGSFLGYLNAQPFTSGFSGFWRATTTFATTTYDSVSLWESEEGAFIQWAKASTGATSDVALGAVFDPLTTGANSAESDGRIYIMSGTGFTSTLIAGWASASPNTDGSWLNNDTIANTCHSGAFAPGLTTMIGGAASQFNRVADFNLTNLFTTVDGDITYVPYWIKSSAGTTAGNWIGQSRQWGMCKDVQSRLTWDKLGVTQGYLVGYSTNTQGDAFVLLV